VELCTLRVLWYSSLDDSHLLSYLTVLGVTHFCDIVLRSGTVANDVHFQAYLLEGIVGGTKTAQQQQSRLLMVSGTVGPTTMC